MIHPKLAGYAKLINRTTVRKAGTLLVSSKHSEDVLDLRAKLLRGAYRGN